MEEGGGVLLPGVDVDDLVGAVVRVAGVALDVVGQPVHGGPLSQEVVEGGGQVGVARHDGLDELSEGGDRPAVSVLVVLVVFVMFHQMFAQLEVVSQHISSGENKSVGREEPLVGISDLYGFHVVLELVNTVQGLGGVTEALHQIPPGLTPGLVGDAYADLVLRVDLQHLRSGRREQGSQGVLVITIRILRGLYRLLERSAGFHYLPHCFVIMLTLVETRTGGTGRTEGQGEIKTEEQAQAEPGQLG